MTSRPVVPYGAWPSPLTADRMVSGAASVGEVRVDGGEVWWTEQRPDEGGRYQLVRRTAAGTRHDVLGAWDPGADAANLNCRTALLEYGGGAWNVRGGVAVFANWADQHLYRVAASGPDAGQPVPLTPSDATAWAWRWSEPVWLDDRWLVCVREDHRPEVVAEHGEAVDELVALPLDGSAVAAPDRVRVLVTGPDFVHTPAVRDDRLVWLQWSHPRMPWDGSELRSALVTRDDAGEPVGTGPSVLVAGGTEESVVQPGFTRAGDLVFCTDRTGWWNPWRVAGDGIGVHAPEPVLAGGGAEVEIGGPLWVGGLRWWTELADGRLLVAARHHGADHLAVIAADGRLAELDTPFTEIDQVVAGADGAVVAVVAASPVAEPAPHLVSLSERAEDEVDDLGTEPTVELERLRPHRDVGLGLDWISVPRHVTFASAGGRVAHALVYPPTNPTVQGPPGERPPLVVMVHGGPTSAARHRLDLAKQYWTTRGFAVVDVDHGGSTGYGRPFRGLLEGGWGVVDVEDAVAAARFLAGATDAGARPGAQPAGPTDRRRAGAADRPSVDADPDRLAIRGGSAGGFTTLAALCFHDTFSAGTSLYGVADLAILAQDTHKFESRYLDGLVGPWPAARDAYEARSPLHHTDGFGVPLLVLQGAEDRVVPPNQAEMIVDALVERRVPHAYVLFQGEGHGFRRSDSIVRALEAELWFYGRVFGFTPADPIEPIEGAVGL